MKILIALGSAVSSVRMLLDKYFTLKGISYAMGSCGYKSRKIMIAMPIRQFLSLCAPLTDGPEPGKMDGVLKAQKFDDVPGLIIDVDGKVTGHEGRHRALYMQEKGETWMPVMLVSRNIRWAHQQEENIDYIEDERWPEHIEAQRSAYRVPFPRRQDLPYLLHQLHG